MNWCFQQKLFTTVPHGEPKSSDSSWIAKILNVSQLWNILQDFGKHCSKRFVWPSFSRVNCGPFNLLFALQSLQLPNWPNCSVAKVETFSMRITLKVWRTESQTKKKPKNMKFVLWTHVGTERFSKLNFRNRVDLFSLEKGMTLMIQIQSFALCTGCKMLCLLRQKSS